MILSGLILFAPSCERKTGSSSKATSQTLSLETIEAIAGFVKKGMLRKTVEDKFGKPNRMEGKSAVYEIWDPRIPKNYGRKGLCGVYIVYSPSGKVESISSVYK